MSSSQQQANIFAPSPTSSESSYTLLSIAPSSYLTVPASWSLEGLSSQSGSLSSRKIETASDLTDSGTTSRRRPHPEPEASPADTTATPETDSQLQSPLQSRLYMSVYSTSSADTEHSEYSNPPARQYRVPKFEKMSRKISKVEKEQYIQALRSHQINTLVELRRVEKAFAVLGTSDVSEPMTSAWSYYVNSHSLLTEVRGLTKNYPFSSHCLDEARNRVYSDPESNKSWNLCWLVLSKIQNDQLIPYYARYQASQSTMWGGHQPSSEQIDQLTDAFVAEWNYAISQMLRHWDQPPTR